MKVLVTTSGVGNVHELKSVWVKQQPKNTDIQVDYNRWNNENYPSRVNSMSPRLKGKILRMLSWEEQPDYDYYIWMDSTISMYRTDVIDYAIDRIGDADICLFKHPEYSTIKEELDLINDWMGNGNKYLINRYEGERCNEQVAYYLNDKEYVDDTLFATGCFIYSKKLVENRNYNLMKEWFYHNCYWSVQDQLSLPYLVSKMKINYKLFDYGIYTNPYFKFETRLVSII